MPSKQILFRSDAREVILRGASALADCPCKKFKSCAIRAAKARYAFHQRLIIGRVSKSLTSGAVVMPVPRSRDHWLQALPEDREQVRRLGVCNDGADHRLRESQLLHRRRAAVLFEIAGCPYPATDEFSSYGNRRNTP